MPRKKTKRRLAVIDFETDPFLFGRVPQPFCVELWDGVNKQVFWGDDCAAQLIDWLKGEDEPLLIYAHNGGKFDFHFLHHALENPALIIKSRIVKAMLDKHELRDSFAILPVPLRNYEKQEIDYALMERDRRDKHRDEILDYLHSDCVHLFNLVSAFIERFGPRMTIGGTAMREMQKMHPHPKCGSAHDAIFRPFYFGGRVQCFKSGKLEGPWKYVDRNSMYPAEMRNKLHPCGTAYDTSTTMPDNFDAPFFITFDGWNNNALPTKDENGALVFNKPYGTFSVCSHELEVALRHNLCGIDRIHIVHTALDTISFRDFVDEFSRQKTEAKESGNKTDEIFAKLVQNSGYGREGINPANFEDWIINRDFGEYPSLEADGFNLQVEYEEIELWSKPAEIQERHYADVAIAASITSAARGNLLENLQLATDAIYCDTDSIICRDFAGDMHKSRLGAWDLECQADTVAIAGKKMYVLYDTDSNGKVVKRKLSSKGGTLTAEQIIRICDGETVRYDNYAPTFSLKRPPMFVSRSFKKTDVSDLALAEHLAGL